MMSGSLRCQRFTDHAAGSALDTENPGISVRVARGKRANGPQSRVVCISSTHMGGIGAGQSIVQLW